MAYSSSPKGRIWACLTSTRSARRDGRADIGPVTQRRVVLRLGFLSLAFNMVLGVRPLIPSWCQILKLPSVVRERRTHRRVGLGEPNADM